VVRISPQQLALIEQNLKRSADPANTPTRGKRAFRLTAPAPSENDVEAGCVAILELRGYWAVKLHAGVFRSLDGKRHVHGVKKGTPDYACLHEKHRGFLMEVKRPGGELSIEQQTEIGFLKLRYRLPIVVVENAAELCNFLAHHERFADSEGGQ
jgi:hypothetical protein